jgi:C1A family cysteine protease
MVRLSTVNNPFMSAMFGTDALAWIFKADNFFNYYNMPDPERITIASVQLDQSMVPNDSACGTFSFMARIYASHGIGI